MDLLHFHSDEIELLDKILNQFSENDKEDYPVNPFNLSKLLNLEERICYNNIEFLYKSELIDDVSNSRGGVAFNLYKINSEGRKFHKKGGFVVEKEIQVLQKDVIETENNLNDIKNKLEILQIKSTIETNEVVKKSIENQRLLTNTSLWIAGAAVFISLATLVKDLSKSDTLQVSPLITTDSILQNTSLRIDSVNQTLQKIDSSINALKSISK